MKLWCSISQGIKVKLTLKMVYYIHKIVLYEAEAHIYIYSHNEYKNCDLDGPDFLGLNLLTLYDFLC